MLLRHYPVIGVEAAMAHSNSARASRDVAAVEAGARQRGLAFGLALLARRGGATAASADIMPWHSNGSNISMVAPMGSRLMAL